MLFVYPQELNDVLYSIANNVLDKRLYLPIILHSDSRCTFRKYGPLVQQDRMRAS